MGSMDQELARVSTGRRGAGEWELLSAPQPREDERRSWMATVPLYHPDTTTSGDEPHKDEGGPLQIPYTAEPCLTDSA